MRKPLAAWRDIPAKPQAANCWERVMEMYGFAGVAVGFLAVAWWLTRLMSATGRNDEDLHGGGASGSTFGS
jgi:hypothetical protein